MITHINYFVIFITFFIDSTNNILLISGKLNRQLSVNNKYHNIPTNEIRLYDSNEKYIQTLYAQSSLFNGTL